jgi:hypothetical protein
MPAGSAAFRSSKHLLRTPNYFLPNDSFFLLQPHLWMQGEKSPEKGEKIMFGLFDGYEEVRRKAVEIALLEAKQDTREVGVKNRGERVDMYLRAAGALTSKSPADKAGLGWCGMFIYYCYEQAASKVGKTLPFTKWNLWSGYKLWTWSKSNPDKVIDTYQTFSFLFPLEPGDIYVMKHKKNNGHIGMVIEKDLDYGTVKTIDGNQSGADSGTNSVQVRTRKFSEMQFLIRI